MNLALGIVFIRTAKIMGSLKRALFGWRPFHRKICEDSLSLREPWENSVWKSTHPKSAPLSPYERKRRCGCSWLSCLTSTTATELQRGDRISTELLQLLHVLQDKVRIWMADPCQNIIDEFFPRRRCILYRLLNTTALTMRLAWCVSSSLVGATLEHTLTIVWPSS